MTWRTRNPRQFALAIRCSHFWLQAACLPSTSMGGWWQTLLHGVYSSILLRHHQSSKTAWHGIRCSMVSSVFFTTDTDTVSDQTSSCSVQHTGFQSASTWHADGQHCGIALLLSLGLSLLPWKLQNWSQLHCCFIYDWFTTTYKKTLP